MKLKKRPIKMSARDLAKILMKILQQPSTKLFLGHVQTIFLANAIEDNRVIIEYSETGEVMGFLVWNHRKVKGKPPSLITKGDFQIKYTAVSDDYKRQGIAATLTKRAEKLAKELGCLRIITQLRTDNVPIISLRKKMNYKKMNTVRQGDIEMFEYVKELSRPKTLFD